MQETRLPRSTKHLVHKKDCDSNPGPLPVCRSFAQTHPEQSKKDPPEGPVILLCRRTRELEGQSPSWRAGCMSRACLLHSLNPPSLDLNNHPSGSNRPHFPDMLMSSVTTQQLLIKIMRWAGVPGEVATGEFCSSFLLLQNFLTFQQQT